MFKKKKEKPFIRFSSPIPGLTEVEVARPQPSRNFIPAGWKGVPKHMYPPFADKNDPYKYVGVNSMIRTAKTCPSFHDVWKEGYVIPAPCDIYLRWNHEEQNYHYETAIPRIPIVIHSNDQYLEHVKEPVHEFIFKMDNVWCIETPPGYSIRQIPMFWHHNPDWESAYGIIHTDQYHQINIQIMMRKGKKEILIKQGEPMCYVVPYKRIDYDMQYVDFDIAILNKADFNNLGVFDGTTYMQHHNKLEREAKNKD